MTPKLPLTATPARAGRNWTVRDADGVEVCECAGEDDGESHAEWIVLMSNAALAEGKK